MTYKCLGCPNRSVGCHSDCESYIRQKAENDAKTELIRKQRALDDMFISHKAGQAKAMIRRKNIKRGRP